MVSNLTELSHWLFGSYCVKEVFQTLHDYNVAQDLAIRTRCDDLDLISRSQVCPNHKLQIVSGFLSTVV